MLLKFELSMPNVGSWNGRWTGEENLYAIIKPFIGKENERLAKEILNKGYFDYNFGDGWRAGVTVEKIDSKEAAKVRRKSKGFCGYNWMVDSIIINKKIIVEEE